MKTPLQDQSEVLAENASLDLRARSLRASIFQKTGETVTPPALPREDAIETNALLKAHVQELEAGMASGARSARATAGAKKQTLTEKVLAARGVKSIAELNTRMESARPNPLTD